MTKGKKILAINGSYRQGGITDQAMNIAIDTLRAAAAVEVEVIFLRDYPIKFCLNCRECMQQPGVGPGHCIQQDGMSELVQKIEQAQGYILAAPTNQGSVTALFKRFMERLAVYAYWPWGENAPAYRKKNEPRKKALLISSCAAPGFIGRWLYGTHKQLKMTAEVLGSEVVGTVFAGLIAGHKSPEFPQKMHSKVRGAALRLL